MKKTLKKKAGLISPVHREWYRHMGNCIEHELCPCCGEDITLREERVAGPARKVFFLACSHCHWRTP